MAYYIYTGTGPNNLWFWAYLLLGIVGLFGESGYVHRRVTPHDPKPGRINHHRGRGGGIMILPV